MITDFMTPIENIADMYFQFKYYEGIIIAIPFYAMIGAGVYMALRTFHKH